MTGFRLGRGGAQELLGIRPDLSCFGKVIGGGLPVGAVGGRADIMDFLAPLGPVYQAGTLSGNPLAMAAGLAQLKVLEEENVFAHLEVLGAELEDAMRGALKSAGLDYSFYRCGSMSASSSRRGPSIISMTRGRPISRILRAISHALLDRGVYIAPSQFETGFLSAAHSREDLRMTSQAVAEALQA